MSQICKFTFEFGAGGYVTDGTGVVACICSVCRFLFGRFLFVSIHEKQ